MPASDVTTKLGVKIVGLDANPVDVASKTTAVTDGIQAHCTSDTFTTGTRTVIYVAPLGQQVTVEFYLRYSTGLPGPLSYCIRNARATYSLTKINRSLAEESDFVARPYTTLTETNDLKISDSSPSSSYEMLKSIIITPASDEYVVITSIRADISHNSG